MGKSAVSITALLPWYEESPNWLAACVASLRGVCDHIVAADGPYWGFPAAHTYPRSGREQAEAIIETAFACNIGLTLLCPNGVWEGGQVEKRDALFRYGYLASPPHGWLLIIDADEVVTAAPPDLRERLAAAEEDVASVWFWQRTVEHALPGDGAPVANPRELRGGHGGQRRLLRALPDLRCEGAHYYYLAGPADAPRILRGRSDLHHEESCLDIPDFKLEHRNPGYRQPARDRAKRDYYETRDRLALERAII